MKHTTSLLFIAAILITTIVHAQDEGSISELYLKGKWTASCAMEVKDKASIRNCEICPFVIDPNDKSKAETKDIEMNFQADSITINQNGKVTTVSYSRNKDNHSIGFSLNGKQYNFRVFFYNKQRILEDGDGLLVVLEKAK